MKDLAIVFLNDNGQYYLETIEPDLDKAEQFWNVKKVVNANKESYEVVKNELNNPTTKDGEAFVVLQNVEEYK